MIKNNNLLRNKLTEIELTAGFFWVNIIYSNNSVVRVHFKVILNGINSINFQNP